MKRVQNEEADAMTNEDFRHFSRAMRIPVDLTALPFVIMNDLFKVGDTYVEEITRMKGLTKMNSAEGEAQQVRRKRPAREKLSATPSL